MANGRRHGRTPAQRSRMLSRHDLRRTSTTRLAERLEISDDHEPGRAHIALDAQRDIAISAVRPSRKPLPPRTSGLNHGFTNRLPTKVPRTLSPNGSGVADKKAPVLTSNSHPWWVHESDTSSLSRPRSRLPIGRTSLTPQGKPTMVTLADCLFLCVELRINRHDRSLPWTELGLFS